MKNKIRYQVPQNVNETKPDMGHSRSRFEERMRLRWMRIDARSAMDVKWKRGSQGF